MELVAFYNLRQCPYPPLIFLLLVDTFMPLRFPDIGDTGAFSRFKMQTLRLRLVFALIGNPSPTFFLFFPAPTDHGF